MTEQAPHYGCAPSTTPHQDLVHATGDAANLASLAAQLVAEAEAGDTERIMMLGAIVRALHAKTDDVHRKAKNLWLEELRIQDAARRAVCRCSATRPPESPDT